MGKEIERRFIVKGQNWKKSINSFEEIKQGYLSTNFDEWITRIRITNNKKALLTLKALIGKLTNYEFEYQIPIEEAESIWKLVSKKIIKRRYIINYLSKEWVVDCFQGNNHPLIIAEIELATEQDLIKKPNWCIKEITGIKSLSNASLAQSPISDWSQEEKQNLHIM
ncbi:CYTH domain-containing protein [Prochlorococcus marinus]|uniref:CYTH domain-containing protein n=1 Tax=Prochlorococcus marinus TaxID=1219 RepID=UPI0022B5278B|nr:CYTH domain-containing protein [Prochlorococcus marinus]